MADRARTVLKRVYQQLHDWRLQQRLWDRRSRHPLQLSIVVVVPLLIGLVTWISNTSDLVAFLLFPPLAAGTYALFADPKRASISRFVLGLTAGAVAGWLAVVIVDRTGIDILGGTVSPEGAALSILFAGVIIWVLGVDEPSAFSTSLLVLVTGADELIYLLNIVAAAIFVGGAFWLYQYQLYGEPAGQQPDAYRRIGVPAWERTAGLEQRAQIASRLVMGQPGGTVVLVADQATVEMGDLDRLARQLTGTYDITATVVERPVADDQPTLQTLGEKLGIELFVTTTGMGDSAMENASIGLLNVESPSSQASV